MPRESLELAVTRLIDAPVEIVWKVATERLAEWWCPRPWTVEIVEQDWRAGGRSAMIMARARWGGDAAGWCFPRGDTRRAFVFTDALTAGWAPQRPFIVGTMAFANEGGRTRYTATARHWTQEAYDRHESMGFEAGLDGGRGPVGRFGGTRGENRPGLDTGVPDRGSRCFNSDR